MLLLAAGYEVPKQLFVHGYLLLDDRKISKSLGNVHRSARPGRRLRRRCGPVLGGARRSRSARTATSSLDSFHERYERELGERPRQPALADDGDDRALPRRHVAGAPDDPSALAAASTTLRDDVPARLDRFDVTGALEAIWDVVRGLNRYVEQTKPWELAKDAAARGRARPGALRPRRRPARRRGRAVGVPARDGAVDPRRARPVDRRRLGAACAYGRTAPAAGIEAAQPLFPRIERAARAA